MLTRSWIAVLLLANYLTIVGMGCMNRPEDQHELLLVRTSDDGQHFQQCRYMLMGGLDAFLNEALASRYQSASDTTPYHLISVINGIDAHCLPDTFCPMLTSACRTAPLLVMYQYVISVGVRQTTDIPPWLG